MIKEKNSIGSVLQLFFAMIVILFVAGSVSAQGRNTGRGASSALERRIGGTEHVSSQSTLVPLNETLWNKEQLKRIRHLENELMCSCPNENWSRTLTGCPDSCADPQKIAIRDLVRSGISNSAILQSQRNRHGPMVLASPTGSLAAEMSYYLHWFAVGGSVFVGIFVLLVWSNTAKKRRHTLQGVSANIRDDELEAIDRELEELE